MSSYPAYQKWPKSRSSTLIDLKEVLMPVLSPSTLPFDPSTGLRAGFAQDKLRINSVEGLNDVNQIKPEFANHQS